MTGPGEVRVAAAANKSNNKKSRVVNGRSIHRGISGLAGKPAAHDGGTRGDETADLGCATFLPVAVASATGKMSTTRKRSWRVLGAGEGDATVTGGDDVRGNPWGNSVSRDAADMRRGASGAPIVDRSEQCQSQHKRLLVVEVTDTGVGMDGRQMKELFKPFSQVHGYFGVLYSIGSVAVGDGLTRASCAFLSLVPGGSCKSLQNR